MRGCVYEYTQQCHIAEEGGSPPPSDGMREGIEGVYL